MCFTSSSGLAAALGGEPSARAAAAASGDAAVSGERIARAAAIRGEYDGLSACYQAGKAKNEIPLA